MKTRQYSNALGEKLSPEQTETVLQWLAQHTYTEVAAMISAAPPEGLGIETSLSAVGRFAIRHAEEIAGYEFEALDSYIVASQEKYRHEEELHLNLEQGNFRLLQEKVFLKLVKGDPTAAELKTLAHVAKMAADRLTAKDLEQEIIDQKIASFRAQKARNKTHGPSEKAA